MKGPGAGFFYSLKMSTPDIMSKFMRKVEDTLKARELSDATIKAYMMRLRLLNGGRAFNSFAFLKDIPAIDAIIEKGKPNTQKNYYTAILGCTHDYKAKKTYKKTVEYYVRKFETVSQSLRTELDKNEKTETQKENWIEWKEVIEIRDKLQAEVDALDLSGSILATDYDKILRNTILALYTYIPPRRNKDYTLMKVAFCDFVNDLPPTHNYYDIKKQRFIFNAYKTATTYGQQIVSIKDNAALIKVLETYIKIHQIHKEIDGNYMYDMLTHFGGTPFEHEYDITRYLNRTFGKNIGPTMLRHIFISDKFDIVQIKKENAEKLQIANDMAHSVEVQQNYMKN